MSLIGPEGDAHSMVAVGSVCATPDQALRYVAPYACPAPREQAPIVSAAAYHS